MNKIINFHDIDNARWFEEVISMLKSKYEMVTAESIQKFYNGDDTVKNACHITVDDGHISFYNVIFPVLKKHNIPATLFVSPKVFLENTNYWFQEIEGFNQTILKHIIENKFGLPVDLLFGYDVKSILKTLKIFH